VVHGVVRLVCRPLPGHEVLERVGGCASGSGLQPERDDVVRLVVRDHALLRLLRLGARLVRGRAGGFSGWQRPPPLASGGVL
jgi:hypothetical protein